MRHIVNVAGFILTVGFITSPLIITLVLLDIFVTWDFNINWLPIRAAYGIIYSVAIIIVVGTYFFSDEADKKRKTYFWRWK